MESSNINELLIAAVQKREALYDKTQDNYSNRVYINRQWKEIGEELGIEDIAARKKWTTLRDYFFKTNKQLSTVKSGSGGEKRRKWYLYDTMKFLLPHIADRKTCSNISEESENEDDNVSQISEASTDTWNHSSEQSLSVPPQPAFSPCEFAESSTQGSTSTGSIDRVSSPTIVRRRKARYPQERSQTVSLDGAILEAIKSMKPTEEQKDEIDLFLQSLAPNMRMLDPFSRIECQAEMQLLILRYMRRRNLSSNPQSLSPMEEQQQYSEQLNTNPPYNPTMYNQYQTYRPQ